MKPEDQDTSQDSPPKDEFEQVVDQLKSANNILVTVSTDPTVDQFAACIGLTLILNKIGKHANAVFSGKAPSTIDFLKPEKTLETDTDSLRDFIIALDKSKADKLRYKVEDEVVKIFITPYKTSIDEKDLQFSQGDFNVDAIIALGVQDKNHIDQAILAHGRILHDAAVISINIDKQSKLGSVNWSDTRASSLCEMAADVAMELDNNVFDSQNATALLTGIVAETDRYSNDKAAPHTMSVAGLLMSAGASTQLVASQLSEKHRATRSHSKKKQDAAEDGGVLEIEHQPEESKAEDAQPLEEGTTEDIPPPPVQVVDEPPVVLPEIPSDDAVISEDESSSNDNTPKIMHEPPEFGGKLTANTSPEDEQYTNSVDPLSDTSGQSSPSDTSVTGKGKTIPAIADNQTLSDIEKAVDSPHLDEQTVVGSTTSIGKNLDGARSAVLQAEADGDMADPRPEALQSMGSTELGSDLNGSHIPPESATLDPNAQDAPPPPVPPPYLPPNS